MSKLYIFGIGGTGARVMRALTMLMASGVRLGADAVVPIIIDPDAGNADLSRTTALINTYTAISQRLDRPGENAFFRTKIESIAPDNMLEIKDTTDESFKNYIGLDTMTDKASECLIRMLFSKKNLDSDMKVGFKGNPNIGSVVLNQIVGSDTFKEFSSQFANGDKIFIINSIFGGTGASGFPLLLKILRYSNANDFPKAPIINNAVIGAVTVLPYFNVQSEDEEKSVINSTTFNSKAKSALAYYEDNIYKNGDIDDLYFIGDDLKSKPYKNVEGGPEQENPAHLIEMLAATAIVDFSNNNQDVRPVRPCCLELGLKDMDDASPVTFSCLNDNLRAMLYKPMIAFTLMANLFHYHFRELADSKQDFNTPFPGLYASNNRFISNLNTFITRPNGYVSWLEEMEQNQRSLKFFNLEDLPDPFKLVAGIEPAKGGLFSKKKYDLLYSKLSKAVRGINVIKNDDPNTFMEMFYVAMSKLVDEKF
jgi:hypothetical protein